MCQPGWRNAGEKYRRAGYRVGANLRWRKRSIHFHEKSLRSFTAEELYNARGESSLAGIPVFSVFARRRLRYRWKTQIQSYGASLSAFRRQQSAHHP